MKVEASRKKDTGMASLRDGGGAVFLEKYHQKDGLRVEMMLSWVTMVNAKKITATTCK